MARSTGKMLALPTWERGGKFPCSPARRPRLLVGAQMEQRSPGNCPRRSCTRTHLGARAQVIPQTLRQTHGKRPEMTPWPTTGPSQEATCRPGGSMTVTPGVRRSRPCRGRSSGGEPTAHLGNGRRCARAGLRRVHRQAAGSARVPLEEGQHGRGHGQDTECLHRNSPHLRALTVNS